VTCFFIKVSLLDPVCYAVAASISGQTAESGNATNKPPYLTDQHAGCKDLQNTHENLASVKLVNTKVAKENAKKGCNKSGLRRNCYNVKLL
jgi:hypothetical protein